MTVQNANKSLKNRFRAIKHMNLTVKFPFYVIGTFKQLKTKTEYFAS